MKREKLIMIVCTVLFVICLVLFGLSNKKEKEQDDTDNVTDTQSTESELQKSADVPESDFGYDKVKFIYVNDGFNIEALLQSNGQLGYFQLTLYEYLYNRGYDDVIKIAISDGEETSDNVKFSAVVHTEDEKEFKIIVEYDIQLLAFYYYFADSILEATPVNLTGVDPDLSGYIGTVQGEMEKKLGEFIYQEKLEATRAEVKWYEVQEEQLVIQLELNDEYKTYCKIYYNLETSTYEFKKWEN